MVRTLTSPCYTSRRCGETIEVSIEFKQSNLLGDADRARRGERNLHGNKPKAQCPHGCSRDALPDAAPILIFLPIFIPGFLFGIIYLLISYWLSKKGGSNINHSAHIWGALFGIVFVLIASKLFGDYPVLSNFWLDIRRFNLSKLFSTY